MKAFKKQVKEAAAITDKEFTRIAQLYSGTVFRTAMCYVKNSSDADDIMQEAFLKLYTYSGAFESDSHIKAWLIRITTNLCKNFLRYRRLRIWEPLENARELEAPQTEENSLLPLIMKLSGNNRIVLYMHYYEGYSVKEISALLKLTETAVTSQLYRGRKQLERLMEKEDFYG
ncbi:MAG: RNA polymerase sigma factor [Ruminiclostridium sp.]|nr:RNA polymerase sigma factor [Ruminiclostridium sp.]